MPPKEDNGVVPALRSGGVTPAVAPAAAPSRTEQPDRLDRVVVGITGAPGSDRLIRVAARLAHRAGAELIGAHVHVHGRSAAGTHLEEHRALLRDLGGTYREIDGESVASALRRLATGGTTQLVIGTSRRPRWREVATGSVLDQLTRDADFDVHVVTPEPSERGAARWQAFQVSRGRRRAAWALALLGVPVLTAALVPWRSDDAVSSSLLLFALLTVTVAAIGGAAPAAAVAVAGFFAVNWFLTPPFHTLEVATAANLVALFCFLAVAAVVSVLVAHAARRSADATRAKAEAEALALAARAAVDGPDPLLALLERVVQTFGFDGGSVLIEREGRWVAEVTDGTDPPASLAEATATASIGDRAVLAVTGHELADDDRRMFDALADQLATALEQRRLQGEAARAAALAETDRLRTALLRSVSHDLRTPLASIKASVSSLRQDDVEWPPAAVEDFLLTIEEETDRLDRVIGNLLDMGRLQAGAVTSSRRPIALEEVALGATTSLSGDTGRIDLRLDERSPQVLADPALLERAVANVLSNALAWAPSDSTVTVTASADGPRVELRIVDHGPGVPASERSRLFEPFQRLGDRSNDLGAGLGLAVARGFVEAMGGSIRMTDTPGGGLTMIIELERATP